MFAPTIEPLNDTDAFLVEEPMKSLERGQFTKVPWITGVNAHEGRFTTAGEFFMTCVNLLFRIFGLALLKRS
jgi:hypothetical protein